VAERKAGLSFGATLALGVLGLAALCLPCGGATMVLGLPAYTRYVRRSQVAEARFHVEMLREHVERWGGPLDLGPTPPLETLGETPRPFGDDPHWIELGFSPPDPVRYSYSVRSDPAAGTVRIEIVGDLDEDGFRSSFALDGRFVPGADTRYGIEWGELVVLDELE
jgi:hypothetical protein